MANDELTARQPVFAGINNVDTEEEIGSSYFLTADNVDITRQRRIVRRPGYTKIFSGSVSAVWGDNNNFLFLSGGTLKRLNSDYTTTDITSVNTETNVLSAVEMSGAIYWTDNVEIGVIRKNINYPLSVPIPELPTISSSVGELPEGFYLAAITFINSLGEEGPASRVEILPSTTSGSLIFSNFIVPTDRNIEKVIIYLSKPNGDVLYRALVVNTDTLTTVSYSNNTNELKYALRTRYLSQLPAGSLIDYFRGHLLVANDSFLYFSESYNLSLFNPVSGFVSFTHKITNIRAMRGGVFVSTERDVIFLSGLDPTEWNYVEVSPFGVAKGTMLDTPGEFLGEGFSGNDKVAVWPTTAGLLAGTDNGSVVNLTSQIFNFPSLTYGSAILRNKDGQRHFTIIAG